MNIQIKLMDIVALANLSERYENAHDRFFEMRENGEDIDYLYYLEKGHVIEEILSFLDNPTEYFKTCIEEIQEAEADIQNA